MRKSILVRVALSMLLGVLIAGVISEVSFLLQDNVSRPPQEVVLVIPNGAAAQTALGQSVLAQELVLVAGDTLVVRNEDVTAHTLGPLYIPPGASASLALDQPENVLVTCSFQPQQTFGLDVRESLTLDTRIQGILLAGVPMGVLLALYSVVVWPLKKARPA